MAGCAQPTQRSGIRLHPQADRKNRTVDPPGKTRHCTLMLLVASVLAYCAPDDLQQRALARYAFLYADALLEWARRWRNELKRVPATKAVAAEAKPLADTLASILDGAGGVRDYLSAKRQSVAGMRADDIEATLLLWAAVNAPTVQALGEAAIKLYDTLNSSNGSQPSIVQLLDLGEARANAIHAALPSRDPDYWYLAADTAADLRPFTLLAAQGGNLGRLVAQINDVAGHLDTLLRIAPLVGDVLPYDWLVRSAIIVELNALLDLAIGAPPGHKRNVMYCLLDVCRRGRAQEAADLLERLRDSIGVEGWGYIRWARNSIGAHVDDKLTMSRVHQELIEMDYQGVVLLAEHSLDWLDAIGATQLDLKLLVIGERRIASWPTDPDDTTPGKPAPMGIPGAIARFFRTMDSPFLSVTASTMGSAVVAGISAGRKPQPRMKVAVPTRPDAHDFRQRHLERTLQQQSDGHRATAGVTPTP